MCPCDTAMPRLAAGRLNCASVGRYPQVGVHRELQPSAEAVPAYRGDGRFGECVQRVARIEHGLPVVARPVGCASRLLEVFDVRTSRERLLSRSGQHHHPYRVVGFQFGEQRRKAQPHIVGDSVPLFRAVQRQRRYGAVALQQ